MVGPKIIIGGCKFGGSVQDRIYASKKYWRIFNLAVVTIMFTCQFAKSNVSC